MYAKSIPLGVRLLLLETWHRSVSKCLKNFVKIKYLYCGMISYYNYMRGHYRKNMSSSLTYPHAGSIPQRGTRVPQSSGTHEDIKKTYTQSTVRTAHIHVGLALHFQSLLIWSSLPPSLSPSQSQWTPNALTPPKRACSAPPAPVAAADEPRWSSSGS